MVAYQPLTRAEKKAAGDRSAQWSAEFRKNRQYWLVKIQQYCHSRPHVTRQELLRWHRGALSIAEMDDVLNQLKAGGQIAADVARSARENT